MIKIPEYQEFLDVKHAKTGHSPSPVHLQFKFTTELMAPGKPGKQVGDIFLIHSTSQSHHLITSLGEQSKSSLENYRLAGGAAGKWLVQMHAENVDLDPDQSDWTNFPEEYKALVEGLFLGGYQFSRYKTIEQLPSLTNIHLLTSQNHPVPSGFLEEIRTVTKAVIMARNWAHEPGCEINPVTLAERVISLADQFDLKYTILDDEKLSQIGAGGILSVGKGSQSKPRLIIMEYPGKPSSEGSNPVVCIGKAITFDSGGYSLKDSTNIQRMKFDKSGGVNIAAIMQAAIQLKISTPLVGIIAAAENMVSAEAYRPDDIIRTLSGKTVEIISTDAEGRLVLADALTYAQQKYSPRAIIDLATLTGGIVVALGHIRAGLFSNNEDLSKNLIAASARTQERIWPMPLDDDYAKLLKSSEADLKNSGGREGAPVLGGVFLKQFVSDDIPWAHIDIAGMADVDKDMPYCVKGATGFGVRLILDYLSNL